MLYSIRRLNCVNGDPVSIETAFIPCLLFPTIEDIDVSVFSLYETYEMLGRKPVTAQEKLDIEALGARDAGLLGLEQGDLALTLECVSSMRAARRLSTSSPLTVATQAAIPIRTSWCFVNNGWETNQF